VAAEKAREEERKAQEKVAEFERKVQERQAAVRARFGVQEPAAA
jgi:cation-transporting ATPase 13A1